jgi:hypothetical protein
MKAKSARASEWRGVKVFGVGAAKMEVALRMRINALKMVLVDGAFNGLSIPWSESVLKNYMAIHRPSGTVLTYTHDEGYHTSGWWKNPDYERCLHLSLSFHDPETGKPAPGGYRFTNEWLDVFFGESRRLLWCEPLALPEEGSFEVWHYRLFCDASWNPMPPEREAPTAEFAARGWKRWPELTWRK